MLFTILAYASLLIAPFISGILLIILMIPLSIFQFVGVNKKYISYLSSLVGGVVLVYLYSLLFNWMKVDFGIFAFLLLLIPIIFNSIQRVRTRPHKQFEKRVGTLEVIGIITGIAFLVLKIA